MFELCILVDKITECDVIEVVLSTNQNVELLV